jgi:4-hydroxybenzoate polyprenyltransferase
MNQVLAPPLLSYAKLMRLDKQTGTMLLLFPCLWSISLAAPAAHLPDLYTVTLFTVGALLMRAAGCIVNDMWDRNIDVHVQRTKDRPLATRELSVIDAWCLLSTCLTGALHVLLSFDKIT